MSIVKSLSVSGYKSIKELTNFELRNLNVLIGANGAGKSNFISLFRLLNEIYEQQLQLYVQKQGGPDALLHFGRGMTERLRAGFYFGSNSYEFDLIPSVDNILIFEYAISVFADVCKQVAEQRQLIISTQSIELVNELSPEDVIVVDQENDASTFRRYTEDEPRRLGCQRQPN